MGAVMARKRGDVVQPVEGTGMVEEMEIYGGLKKIQESKRKVMGGIESSGVSERVKRRRVII